MSLARHRLRPRIAGRHRRICRCDTLAAEVVGATPTGLLRAAPTGRRPTRARWTGRGGDGFFGTPLSLVGRAVRQRPSPSLCDHGIDCASCNKNTAERVRVKKSVQELSETDCERERAWIKSLIEKATARFCTIPYIEKYSEMRLKSNNPKRIVEQDSLHTEVCSD